MQNAEATLFDVEGMDCSALGQALKDWKVLSNEPGGGNISDPFPFNLMFKTSIGPSGQQTGFLRPETAQGIFVSFRDLLYYNGGRLPFAAAQIGQSFRNEINPKQGLLRVREFTQAEIEHFVHPDKKDHPRFKEVADVAPLMHSSELQQAHKPAAPMKLGEAVAKGIVANETLGYFIGRTHLFLVAVGINPARMTFRQHLPNEMAHYACGAWPLQYACMHDVLHLLSSTACACTSKASWARSLRPSATLTGQGVSQCAATHSGAALRVLVAVHISTYFSSIA